MKQFKITSNEMARAFIIAIRCGELFTFEKSGTFTACKVGRKMKDRLIVRECYYCEVAGDYKTRRGEGERVLTANDLTGVEVVANVEF